MTQIAHQTGATLHVTTVWAAQCAAWSYGASDDRGTQSETAQLEGDGTLRVTGHHTEPGVSVFFGDAITCYDWTT